MNQALGLESVSKVLFIGRLSHEADMLCTRVLRHHRLFLMCVDNYYNFVCLPFKKWSQWGGRETCALK